MEKRYEKLVHIVGIPESTKFLLKDVCSRMKKTQLGWIEEHLAEDQKRLNREEGKM